MEKYISFRGIRLVYQVEGSGHPLMLLHGFGEDSRIWEYQVAALKEKAMLIMPDLPGSGKSALPDGYTPFLTMEDFAEALHDILDNEEIQHCTLIGHSMGGYITLAFAEKYPERLQAFGLFHSTARADSAEKQQARLKGISFCETYGAGKFLAEVIPTLYGEDFKVKYPEQVEKHVNEARSFSNEAIIGYYRAMLQRPDRQEVLQNFAKPVLFIMGKEDKTVHLGETLPQCHLPRESHVHIWQGVAHMGMRENPLQTSAVLKDFLAHVNES